MLLAKRIRTLRYKRGLALMDLASRAKISKTALHQIEQGTISMPRAGTLKRIAQALKVPLEALLDMSPLPSYQGEDALIGTMKPATAMTSPMAPARPPSGEDRTGELMEKFRVLLGSPLAEGVARIVDDSYRLLPIIPPPGAGMDRSMRRSPRSSRQSRRGHNPPTGMAHQ